MAIRLHHAPDWAAQMEAQPVIRSAKFGEGYEQRTADGIHALMPKWSVSFTGKTKADADDIEAFFRAMGGVTAFELTLPDSQWSVEDHGFGFGDGERTQFILQRTARTRAIRDWQGEATVHTRRRSNYLGRTEDFSNAIWDKQWSGTGLEPVVTSNQAMAPDGTPTADRLRLDKGTGAVVGIHQNDQGGYQPYNIDTVSSVWMRTADGSTRLVALVCEENGVPPPMTLCTVTPEWQRFQVYVKTVSLTSTRLIGIQLRTDASTATSADLYVWGAQHERGVTEATEYIPNLLGTQNVEVTPAVFDPAWLPEASDGFVPALGWSEAARPTLYVRDWAGTQQLHEVPRTNYLAQSVGLYDDPPWEFTNIGDPGGAVVGLDGQVSPGMSVLSPTGSGQHRIKQDVTGTVRGRQYTYSVYISGALQIRTARLEVYHGGALTSHAWFNIEQGTVGTVTSGGLGATSAIEDLSTSGDVGAEPWYRCSITWTAGSDAPDAVGLLLGPMDTEDETTSWTVSGTSAVTVFGAQLEDGPVPTKLIYTDATSLTVTDYTLASNGLVTLSEALEGQLSFTAEGDDLRRVLCRKWRRVHAGHNNYDVIAELEEVAA